MQLAYFSSISFTKEFRGMILTFSPVSKKTISFVLPNILPYNNLSLANFTKRDFFITKLLCTNLAYPLAASLKEYIKNSPNITNLRFAYHFLFDNPKFNTKYVLRNFLRKNESNQNNSNVISKANMEAKIIRISANGAIRKSNMSAYSKILISKREYFL